MLKKSLLTALIITCIITSLTGCSPFTRRRGYGDKDYQVTVAKSEEEIPDGSYYVKKANGEYHRAYIGETTFRMDVIPYSADPTRICWFGKDFDRIPTVQKGEEIVYRSTSEFTPSFLVERFADLGYTIGISGLIPTQDGRYVFSTDASDKKIDIDTSANVIYQLGAHNATIEKIGGAQLRSGNISSGGTIVGLEQGRNYKLDLYIGTEVQQYTLTADVRAMSSMQIFKLTDFEYIGSNVIVIRLPENLESGYYLLGNFGMIRYIDSDKEFAEDMDMNVPNGDLAISNPSQSTASQESTDGGEEQKPSTPSVDTVTDHFRLEKATKVRIIFTWEDSESGRNYAAPAVKAVGGYGVYTLNENADGTALTGTYDLPEGDYRLDIEGLYDRVYSFQIIDMSKGGSGEELPAVTANEEEIMTGE